MKNLRCVVLLLLFSSIYITINSQVNTIVDISSGLQIYWKFDEGIGSSIFDFSGNNQNSVSISNATWALGKSSTAISFDSTTYIDFGTSNLNLVDEITVSYWVFFQPDNGRYYTRSIMNKGSSVYPFAFQILGNSYPKTLKIITRTASGVDNLNSVLKLSANTWYHIVLTYKTGEKRLYIDGVINSSSTNCSGNLTLEKNRIIGLGKESATSINNNSFIGKIDELRIFNRALSEIEVKALYDSSGLDLTPPATLEYVYDGTGNDMDSSGSVNSISANWPVTTDAESKITKYYYAIGTSPGKTDIADWTNNMEKLSFLKRNINLSIGNTYYVSVKAENSSGLQSEIKSSDGIKIIDVQYKNIIHQDTASRPSGNLIDVTIKQNFPLLSEVNKFYFNTPSAGLFTWRDSWRSGNYGFTSEINKTGLKSIRVGSYYNEMLRDDEMQNLATAARNDNIKIMFTALGKQRLQTGEFSTDQQFIDAYISFLDTIIGRFGPNGKYFEENPSVPYEPINYWEVWNEPDLYYMLGNEHPNDLNFAEKADLYSKLLIAAYNHIRSKPEWNDIKVVAMSIAGVGDETLRFAELVHSAIKANGGDPSNSYDILSIHPYTHDCPPDIEDIISNTSGVISYTYSLVNESYKVREDMAKWGNANKPLWYTEVGWSRFNGPNPNGRPFPVTERQQASYLARLYAMAIRLGIEQVHTMFVIDGDGSNSGFFYRNPTTREVTVYEQAKAAETFTNLMPIPKITSVISDGELGYYAYRINPNIDDPKAKEVIMAWNVEGPLTVNIPMDTTKNYLLVDLFGNMEHITAQNNQIEIPIGPSPVYLVKDNSLPKYTILKTPEELKLISAGETNATLSWMPSTSSDISSYTIFRDGKEVSTVTTNTWTDAGLNSNTYYNYFVVAKNINGISSRPSNEINVKTTAKTTTNIEISNTNFINVFPNPVSNIAKIEFYLSEITTVSINIYNSTGQIIKQINRKNYTSGIHQIEISTENLNSGMYYIQLCYNSQQGALRKSLAIIK